MWGKILKRLVGVLFLVPFLLIGDVYSDFDRIIDFSLNLKELQEIIDRGEAGTFNTNKIVLLSGTIADLRPRSISRNFFFYLQPTDIIHAAALKAALSRPANAVITFVAKNLSDAAREFIYGRSEKSDELIKDLNVIIKNNTLFTPELVKGLTLPAALMDLIRFNPVNDQEKIYLNRLLLEAILREALKPVRVEILVVSGEWISPEEVKSYYGWVSFGGPESFKLFHRFRDLDSSALHIPVTTRVLVVAKPDQVITHTSGQNIWFFGGIYIRAIK